MELPGDFLVGRLLRRCADGEEQALLDLMDLTWAPADRLVRCITGREESEDVLLRAYVEVWDRSAHISGPHPAAEVLAIVHRCADASLRPSIRNTPTAPTAA